MSRKGKPEVFQVAWNLEHLCQLDVSRNDRKSEPRQFFSSALYLMMAVSATTVTIAIAMASNRTADNQSNLILPPGAVVSSLPRPTGGNC